MLEEGLKILINKYITNKSSSKEQNIIEGFLDSYQNDDKKWNEKTHGEQKEVEGKIFTNIQKNIQSTKTDQFRISPTWKYSIAASFVIIIALGYGIFRMVDSSVIPEIVQIVKKEIPRGQKYMVRLSDGTTIYINSESTLSYPEHFSDNLREITLQGEAFFEVVPDPNKPFIVHTGKIKTEVLGTSFNINTHYGQIKVSVASGKVRVQNINPEITYDELSVLKANQQLVFDKKDQSIEVNEVTVDQFLAWKQKRLVFNDEPLSQVVKRLEKWYDVEFTYLNEDIKNCVFTAVFENEPLTSVLETLQNVADINYDLQGKKIQLSGHGCLN